MSHWTVCEEAGAWARNIKNAPTSPAGGAVHRQPGGRRRSGSLAGGTGSTEYTRGHSEGTVMARFRGQGALDGRTLPKTPCQTRPGGARRRDGRAACNFTIPARSTWRKTPRQVREECGYTVRGVGEMLLLEFDRRLRSAWYIGTHGVAKLRFFWTCQFGRVIPAFESMRCSRSGFPTAQ